MGKRKIIVLCAIIILIIACALLYYNYTDTCRYIFSDNAKDEYVWETVVLPELDDKAIETIKIMVWNREEELPSDLHDFVIGELRKAMFYESNRKGFGPTPEKGLTLIFTDDTRLTLWHYGRDVFETVNMHNFTDQEHRFIDKSQFLIKSDTLAAWLEEYSAYLTGTKAYSLTIKSNIPESWIFLDGSFVGRSPVELTITPGHYKIRVVPPEGSGLEPVTEGIEVSPALGSEIYIDFNEIFSSRLIVGRGDQVAWSTDSEKLAYFNDRSVSILDLTSKEQKEMELPEFDFFPPRLLGWLENDRFVALQAGPTWAVNPGEAKLLYENRVTWSRDLDYLLDGIVLKHTQGKIIPVKEIPLQFDEDLLPLEVSREGHVLLVDQGTTERQSVLNGTLYLVSADSNKTFTLNEDPFDFAIAEFSPRGRFIAVQHYDESGNMKLSLYCTREGKRIAALPWSSRTRLMHLDFNSNDSVIVFIDEDDNIVLYNLLTGERKEYYPGLPSLSYPRLLGEDTVLFLSYYGDDAARLVRYNLVDGSYESIAEPVDYHRPVMAISPDGKKVVYKTISGLLVLINLKELTSRNMQMNYYDMDEETVVNLYVKGIEKYWYVMGGGSGDRLCEQVKLKDLNYRYLGSNIGTKEKLLIYLQEIFTLEASQAFINQVGILEHHGRLIQPDDDGGSLLEFEKVKASLLDEKEDIKEYEIKVPLPEEVNLEDSVFLVRVKKVQRLGWRIDTPAHELYGFTLPPIWRTENGP
jgi:WD40 repeat protein